MKNKNKMNRMTKDLEYFEKQMKKNRAGKKVRKNEIEFEYRTDAHDDCDICRDGSRCGSYCESEIMDAVKGLLQGTPAMDSRAVLVYADPIEGELTVFCFD